MNATPDQRPVVTQQELSNMATGGAPIMWRDMRIDDVESGLPLVTIQRPEGGEPIRFRLAPDAVRAFVDGLAGVAPPPPGECRIVIRCDADTLAKVILANSQPEVK